VEDEDESSSSPAAQQLSGAVAGGGTTAPEFRTPFLKTNDSFRYPFFSPIQIRLQIFKKTNTQA